KHRVAKQQNNIVDVGQDMGGLARLSGPPITLPGLKPRLPTSASRLVGSVGLLSCETRRLTQTCRRGSHNTCEMPTNISRRLLVCCATKLLPNASVPSGFANTTCTKMNAGNG
ncbi:hypothetical protein CH063_04405, partial [Colletotrichum higginsianum]